MKPLPRPSRASRPSCPCTSLMILGRAESPAIPRLSPIELRKSTPRSPLELLTMLLLLLTSTLWLAASDEPEPVAMVLSVKGDVKLRRMDLLRSGTEVRVPASGSVRLVFLADGHRETLNPGGTVRITESGGTPP